MIESESHKVKLCFSSTCFVSTPLAWHETFRASLYFLKTDIIFVWKNPPTKLVGIVIPKRNDTGLLLHQIKLYFKENNSLNIHSENYKSKNIVAKDAQDRRALIESKYQRYFKSGCIVWNTIRFVILILAYKRILWRTVYNVLWLVYGSASPHTCTL